MSILCIQSRLGIDASASCRRGCLQASGLLGSPTSKPLQADGVDRPIRRAQDIDDMDERPAPWHMEHASCQGSYTSTLRQ